MPTLENCLFHGLPAVRLSAANGASATITLHGAHVVSWLSAAGVEQLYLSPNTRFESGQAIRGGVPVVFPQFNTRGVLPRHGFARTCRWAVREDEGSDPGACSVTLDLQNHKVIQSLWPFAFGCALTVALQEDRLVMTLTVSNKGTVPLSFQAALHTYLAVGAIESVVLSGLEGSAFEDCTAAGGNAIKPHTPFKPFDATDRIYFNAPDHLQLQSALGQTELLQSGFNDVVVWNPGGAAAACPPDLPQDGFRHFLCVEAARIGQPVELGPEQVWSGTQTLRAAR
ncbi:MAG: D-hexose-6-phosphate mutarotase [Rhodoferax sp.]|nr:D-hexose-6-phosphate mutarotase [Rhodoferax sp.]